VATVGGAGSALYMINHGFSTAGLFLVAGMFISRRGSKRIPDFGGWQRVTPALAGVWLLVGLSGLALPGLGSSSRSSSCWPGRSSYQVVGVIATTSIILAALYILLMYQRTMTGPKPESAAGTPDISYREKWVVGPLALFSSSAST
jgi:NADH-quinone oxidoreductase subunit M